MLPRMVMALVVPAGVRFRGACGPVSVPQVLDGCRRTPTSNNAVVVVSARIVKWRPFLCQRVRQFHSTGEDSIWAVTSGLASRSRSRKHDFRGSYNVTDLSSYRRSASRINSDGWVASVRTKTVSAAEALLVKCSGRESSATITSDVLIKSIIFEARRGCVNVVGKTKRFDDFLLEQVTAQAEKDRRGSSLESRKLFRALSEAIKQYDQMGKVQRLALLNKVERQSARVLGDVEVESHGESFTGPLLQNSVIIRKSVAESLGFPSLLDLIAHGTASVEASQGLQLQSGRSSGSSRSEVRGVQKDSKPKAVLRQVRGIKYGNSDPIKLPDEAVESTSPIIAMANSEARKSPASGTTRARRKTELELSDNSRDSRQMETVAEVEGSERSESVPAEGSNGVPLKKIQKNVLQRAEKGRGSVARSVVVNASNATKTNLNSYSVLEPSTETAKIRPSRVSKKDQNWGIDTPISAVKSLSALNRARLEENGFNTMRLLLQHYPRMYQNFQQAGQRVEDGQNLSFVGVIVNSKGLPRGPSLGLVEVIVKSEVDEFNTSDTMPSETGEGGLQNDDLERGRMRRTVFLHLKRFFKGSRYSNPGFLNLIARKYPENRQVSVCGKVKQLPIPDHFEIREFNIELWDGVTGEEAASHLASDPELLSGGKPYPVYPGKGSLQPKTIEFCIQRLLPLLTVALDPIPKPFREQFQIQDLHDAYRGIHSPGQSQDAEVARRRLVFDEFFYLQLGMLLQRQELADKGSPIPGATFDLATVLQGGVLDMEQWSTLTTKVLKTLQYTLTDSQITAAGEVLWDLRRPLPMNRLLQGDVGCGKTIVAFLGLLEVLDAGHQGALMAPTEFLANQHYQRITSWLEKLDEADRPTVALLTGSTTLSKARAIRRGFESGEIALAVGTHSLISDSVKFSALGLAVIDEQHRFGVAQRGRFNTKFRDPVQIPDGEVSGDGDVPTSAPLGAPHVLAMSATPIPRTLALAMHGDMSLSQITELPPGRADTVTNAIHGDKKGREAVYKRVRKELEGGGRVFVVFPVIDESEEIPDLRAAETEFKILEEDFKEFRFGLVHGRLRAQEKDEAMARFKSGETQVLVSTTVIEVGIDIPEASMIVVEHAERYGMAQLHQLRGRVGRGSRASSCILLGSRPSSMARLKLLETSRDGFYLAEVDLQQRGPGDMLGKRQSGYLPEFNIARLEMDGDILEQARSAAEEVLQLHPKLEGLPKIRYELSMRRPPASLS